MKPAGHDYFHGDDSGCALGMAVTALGWENRHAPSWLIGTRTHTLWPWLSNALKVKGGCPVCSKHCAFFGPTITHLFDDHVMKGDWALEQLVDWVRSVEPDEKAPVESNELQKQVIPENVSTELSTELAKL